MTRLKQPRTAALTAALVIIGIAAIVVLMLPATTITAEQAASIAARALGPDARAKFSADPATLPACDETFPCTVVERATMQNRNAWQVTFVCGQTCAYRFWIDAATGRVL